MQLDKIALLWVFGRLSGPPEVIMCAVYRFVVPQYHYSIASAFQIPPIDLNLDGVMPLLS